MLRRGNRCLASNHDNWNPDYLHILIVVASTIEQLALDREDVLDFIVPIG